MDHIGQLSRVELLPGVLIPVIPTLPALLKIKDRVACFVTNGPVAEGDKVKGVFQKEYVITKIIESRPAMGDWSGASYADKNPVFTKAEVL